jgi:hypothetical protein
MTSFSRGLKISGRVQKRGKVEKVTGSQDDDFVEGTEKHLVGYKKRERTEKVTGSQGRLSAPLPMNKCSFLPYLATGKSAAPNEQKIKPNRINLDFRRSFHS